jgi:hypothetical protein
MKALDLFGLKFFEEERVLKFRYVVFLNQLKPKIFFEKQLQQYEVIRLDEGLKPKVSGKPDMDFINAVIGRLIQFFEGLQYKQTKNAIIYYEDEKGVYMLSKSTMVPLISKGITPKTVVKYNHMPEQMVIALDSMISQIINYYMAHWSHVLMYYNYVKRV